MRRSYSAFAVARQHEADYSYAIAMNLAARQGECLPTLVAGPLFKGCEAPNYERFAYKRRYIGCHSRSVNNPDIGTKSSVDCFAWQYAFYTHLLYRKAPGSAAQLLDVTRVVYLMRGHRDPIRVADETLRSWPFTTPE